MYRILRDCYSNAARFRFCVWLAVDLSTRKPEIMNFLKSQGWIIPYWLKHNTSDKDNEDKEPPWGYYNLAEMGSSILYSYYRRKNRLDTNYIAKSMFSEANFNLILKQARLDGIR